MWNWLSAQGRSGGILLGVKIDHLELEDCKIRDFSIEVTVRNRVSNFRWVLLIVYGPAHHDLSANFLED